MARSALRPAERAATRLVDKWLDYQDPLPKPPEVPIRLRPLRQRQGFLVESDLRRLRAMIVDALEKWRP